ncbi:MAG: vitamin B12-dependent ribonucleotide reductase [Acidobacteriota bacterium]
MEHVKGQSGATGSDRKTSKETSKNVHPQVENHGAEVMMPSKKDVVDALAPFRLTRRFTREGADPYSDVAYTKRDCRIMNTDGSTVFELKGAEIPETWSQLATDIVVSKYFRKAGVPGTEHEVSVRQVVHRIVHTLRTEGERLGSYFVDKEEADVFEQELVHLLLTQKGAFNSPVWFNLGLWHEYGIEGQGGAYSWNPNTDKIEETANAYEHPQCSACFIQSVRDDLMSIFQLAKNEARLFKYGSGTGSNFSRIRSRDEKLSGGGTSSGLMSFLDVLDRAAGATKSGGTTRRAAKMVVLDVDHPEILDFIRWKRSEEAKARLLKESGVELEEAVRTVSGQNANNSVRVTDEFMEACEKDGDVSTYFRTNHEVASRLKARDVMREISQAAWECGDPGLQFDTTINRWHTCKATDRIHSSNPCSEYMFLDDSACNLASINLIKFTDEKGDFDVEGFKHAVSLFITAQEILVDLCSYPTAPIAQNSHDYRPLGLGYANLGTLLMVKGVPYDSPKARAWCGAITSLMTGHAYTMSAVIAQRKGPFPGFVRNRDSMLEVIGMHRDASHQVDASALPEDLALASRQVWDDALVFGRQHGYRNAQATVIAPTGTIGLLMDCDTTGIEPDFSLVKFKKLAGGGYFKIVNQSVKRALETLGYNEIETADIITYLVGTGTLKHTPHINPESLKAKGLDDKDISKIEKQLSRVLDLSQAFSAFVIGKDTLARLGIDSLEAAKPGFSLLSALGFTREEIEEAGLHACGHATLEGAPHLREEHLPVFDCANRCGKHGKRFIAPLAHVKMMSAAQPFISGAISKTVNLPGSITPEEIERIYMEGWKRGIKAIAVYRDGSKVTQPLSDASTQSKKVKAKPAAQPGPVQAPEIWRTPLQRRRLPKKRDGFTQEARVGGQKVYLRTGEYEDGRLGEIFIDMHKEGAAFRSLTNCFAIAVSLGLQYGVPLDEYVDCFTFTRFEPQGTVVGHPNIKYATSVIDYLFRVLALEYQNRTDLVQVAPTESATQPMEKTITSPTSSRKEVQEAEKVLSDVPVYKIDATEPAADALSQHLGTMMGDAPFCNICGHITVRNGSCYRCLNCGNSLGCS